jgi:hypothetical protein
MRDIIRKLPTEPYLVRIYADLLLKHEMAEEAAKVYNSAERFVFFLKLSASRPAKRLKKSVIW